MVALADLHKKVEWTIGLSGFALPDCLSISKCYKG